MGDQYLRRRLVTGMTSLERRNLDRPESDNPQIIAALVRKPLSLANMAMAKRTARLVWASMV